MSRVFIVSGGRTGTRSLGLGLQSIIEDCVSSHEPDVVKSFADARRVGLKELALRALGRSGTRSLGVHFLAGTMDRDAIFDRLRKSRPPQDRLAIESNYQWWPFAPVLGEIFPGCRVIGIIRDREEWVDSWASISPTRRNGAWQEIFPGHHRPHGETQTDRLRNEWQLIADTLHEAASLPNVRIFSFEDIFFGDAMEGLVRFAAGGRNYGDCAPLKLARHNSSPRIAPAQAYTA